MPDLSELSPEELCHEIPRVETIPEAHAEILRELRAYRAMRAKAEDIIQHSNDGMYGYVYLGHHAAHDILAAATPAESEGK